MGFSDQFEPFLIPSQMERQQAFENGLIILDTNVLFTLYRFAPTARDELLNLIEGFSDRMWIPHQVGLEFHRRRPEVVVDLGVSYNLLHKAVSEARDEVLAQLGSKIKELSNRAGLSDSENAHLDELARTALDPLAELVAKMKAAHGLGSVASDPILDRLQRVFNGRIGEPFEGDELERHLALASERLEAKIPPGFKDASKEENSHGDYFVWIQSLLEAKRRESSSLLVVTTDRKEDWFLRVHGQTQCARPELAAEARRVAGARLILMDVRTFLEHGGKYLKTAVSPDTLRQAEAIPVSTRQELIHLRKQMRGRVVEAVMRIQDLEAALAKRERAVHHYTAQREAFSAEHAAIMAALSDGKLTNHEVMQFEKRLQGAVNGRHIAELKVERYSDGLARIKSELAEARHDFQRSVDLLEDADLEGEEAVMHRAVRLSRSNRTTEDDLPPAETTATEN